MKQYSILAMIFLLLPAVLADCIAPEDGVTITESASLCPGNYSLAEGFKLQGNNLVLDCQSAALRGKYTGIGLVVTGKENRIQGCIIERYDVGIQLNDAIGNIIQNITLIDNRLGMGLVDAYENIIREIVDKSLFGLLNVENAKFNVLQFDSKEVLGGYCMTNNCNSLEKMNPCEDADGYCSDLCKEKDADCTIPEPAVSTANMTIEERMPPEAAVQERIIPNTIVSEEILEKLDINSKKYRFAVGHAAIQKQVKVDGELALYKVTIVAKDQLNNLIVYEYFPEKASIAELPEGFVEKGNAYEFKIGTLKVNQEVAYEFKADADAVPITIPVASQWKAGKWWQYVVAYVVLLFLIQYHKWWKKKEV